MTQTPDNTPIVYEDDLNELAHLVLNNPDHPKSQEIKRIADELEKSEGE